MITVPELAAQALGSFLADHMTRRFGSADASVTEVIPLAARLALDCIGNSDALYHNVEHTMLVTLAGYDIMRGRALLMPTDANDFAHLILACLFHDIGYVRGILKGDGADGYVVDGKGGKIKLPRGASDAALMPYHVDRSKLFVMDRLANSNVVDAARIARAIEFTRFPPVETDNQDKEDGLHDRVSLGGGTQLTSRRDRGRVRSVESRCHCHLRYPASPRRKAGDVGHPDRLRGGERSGWSWPRRQSGATRRERHRSVGPAGRCCW